jgi:muconolactone delta-isomerase
MRFMIQITMKPDYNQEELFALLPAQGENDKRLLAQGIQEMPALIAADRSIGWLVFNCDSNDHLQEVLQQGPLYAMSEYVITPLLATEENVPS